MCKENEYWMLSNFLILNSEKTKVLLLRPRAARSKLSDYTVTLNGLSVTSYAAVMVLGVNILRSRLLPVGWTIAVF